MNAEDLADFEPQGLWRVYTNGHRSPGGLRDVRKGIGVRQVLVLNTT